MKATFDRVSMLGALRAVSACVPSERRFFGQKPILQNVKIAVRADKTVELAATDLEMAIVVKFNNVEVFDPGECLFPAELLQAVFTKIIEEVVSIEAGVEIGIGRVTSATSDFQLATDVVKEYPDLGRFEIGDRYYSLESAALLNSIRRTEFAADVESTRYALNGVLLEPNCRQLKCVATDGRRLAIAQVPATPVEPAPVEGVEQPKPIKQVIPIKACKVLAAALPDEGLVKVEVTDSRVTVLADGVSVTTRIIEGRFPQYEEVFPSRREFTAELPVEEFARRVEQAHLTTSEEARGTMLRFARIDSDQARLSFHSRANERGESDNYMTVRCDGLAADTAFEIAVDGRYLIEAFRVLPPDSEITAEFIDHASVILFHTETRDWSYLMMPITRDR